MIRAQGPPQLFRHIRTARDRIREQPDIDNSKRPITVEIKKYALARPPFCFPEAELAALDSGIAERQDLQSKSRLDNDEIECEVGLPVRVGFLFGPLQDGKLNGLRKGLLLL